MPTPAIDEIVIRYVDRIEIHHRVADTVKYPSLQGHLTLVFYNGDTSPPYTVHVAAWPRVTPDRRDIEIVDRRIVVDATPPAAADTDDDFDASG